MGCSVSNNDKIIQVNLHRLKVETITNYLWLEYLTQCSQNDQIRQEMTKKEVVINEKTILFHYVIKGDKPELGYPLFIFLHNGEIGEHGHNTIEYLKMQTRYNKSIQTGILLTMRGTNDLSNMHESNEALTFIDHIIKNMISYCNADANKVYLLGVGLGGNAVFKIASKLTDRFAAICVISGHSYGNSLKNLIDLPMMIQVGELDYAYDRNKNAVKVYQKMKDYYALYKNKNGECKVYIHVGKDVAIRDNKKDNKPQKVIIDPESWLVNQTGESQMINTNSIVFLSRFIRNPLPVKLIWEIGKNSLIAMKETHKEKKIPGVIKKEQESVNSGAGTAASFNIYKKTETMVQSQYFYWLEISNRKQEEIGNIEIRAEYNRIQNLISLEGQLKYIVILLNDEMVDFSKEVKFKYKDVVKTLLLVRNSRTEKRTLIERGDINYIFSVAVEFESTDMENFTVTPYDEL